MLNSWFGSKDHEKTNESTAQSDLHRIITHATDGADEALQSLNQTPPIGFTSPHDAVLAQMRGEPYVEGSSDIFLREEVSGLKVEDPKSGMDTVRKEILYEPFDGTPIGFITTNSPTSFSTPHQIRISESSVTDIPEASKEEQWGHLSKVLDLQNELARMHLEMESSGAGDGKGKNAAKGRSKGKGKADTSSWDNRNWPGDISRDWKPKRQTTTDTIGADMHDGDEEGVDAAGNEEIEVKKAREEELSSMAEQFEGRKESIQGIMLKLDQLSKALTEFHTLQAPTIEFANTGSRQGSRQNSTTPDATPPHIQSKIPPYTSASLPLNAASTKFPPLRPVLPTVPSLRGSIPQIVLSDSTGDSGTLPASLSRAKVNAVEKPIIVNVMEPGRHTDSPEAMPAPLPTE
ncbi:hypothetical protein H0H87_012430 [Tephrocybe sp. NHM501043]|nr:hypothetical protein H0H87_012430 [Tephrocybe sp. NHM501043]